MTQIHLLNPANALRKQQPGQKRSGAVASATPEAPVATPVASPERGMAPSALMQVYFSGSHKNTKARLDAAQKIANTSIDPQQFRQETEVLSWNQYLEKLFQQPRLSSNSYQRIYEMIEAAGKVDTGKVDKKGDRIYSYNFFTQPNPILGEHAISGMDLPLHKLVKALKSAAEGGDIKNRFFMFEGPVGTAKSTIMTLLKRGAEEWSKSDQGAMYALYWDNIPEAVANDPGLQLSQHPKTQTYFYEEPMHDDPLRVIPEKPRQKVLSELNTNFAQLNGGRAPYRIHLEGGLSPASDLIRQKLMEFYSENPQAVTPGKTPMQMVLSHVNAKRMVLDETKRIGIATYMPKDPKNQDSTELNGDIDYSKLPMYGDPNHPLVQAYKGEFCVANRGIMEFVEILKLQREFLYDMLTAAQERRIKPKNGTMIPTDMIIVGHTNMEELDEKKKDGKMKAFFNRAVRIQVPYLLDPAVERKIYEKGFLKRVEEKGLKLAPHALDICAEWAVLTRKDPEITKTAENSANNSGRGLYGTSPRFLQSVFSYALVHSQVEETGSITPFTMLRIINEQLEEGGILDDKNLPRYQMLLGAVAKKLDQTLRNDVSNAFMKDNVLLEQYLMRYIKNLALWSTDPAKADDPFMSRVEMKLSAPVNEVEKREFRDNLLRRFNALEDGPLVLKADMLDQADHLRQALSQVMIEDMHAKLDSAPTEAIVEALVKNAGYDEASAKEVVAHLTTPGGIL